jgi:hypothetical protein
VLESLGEVGLKKTQTQTTLVSERRIEIRREDRVQVSRGGHYADYCQSQKSTCTGPHSTALQALLHRGLSHSLRLDCPFKHKRTRTQATETTTPGLPPSPSVIDLIHRHITYSTSSYKTARRGTVPHEATRTRFTQLSAGGCLFASIHYCNRDTVAL